jgi:hypothetical protein
MCDYSLHGVAHRPAKVGDKLTSHNFGTGTRGFRASGDTQPGRTATAICVLPGTEIKFDKDVRYWQQVAGQMPVVKTLAVREARFRQIDKDKPNTYHDVLEFAGGQRIFLTSLVDDQDATVLQLPAKPQTAAERQEQRRAEYV